MSDNMIRIEGLTKKQKAIMDVLWMCDSLEQANLVVDSLAQHKDRCDARSLMHIALVESLEQEGALDEYKDAAADCISLAMLR
jgi:hypothetical protein